MKKKNSDIKVQKATQNLTKMKQRLDEEKLKTKSEQDSKIVTENELRDKKISIRNRTK